MQKFISLLVSPFVAVGLFFAAANAQTLDGSQLNRLITELELSESQAVVVRPILLEGFNERLAIMESAGIEPGQKPKVHQMIKVRAPMIESSKKTESRLSAVLTTGQMVRYRDFVEKVRGKFRAAQN